MEYHWQDHIVSREPDSPRRWGRVNAAVSQSRREEQGGAPSQRSIESRPYSDGALEAV